MTKPDDHDGGESERDRRAANIFLLVFFVAVVAIGWWLVDALITQRELDNCLAQGRRNCAPVQQPVAPPR